MKPLSPSGDKKQFLEIFPVQSVAHNPTQREKTQEIHIHIAQDQEWVQSCTQIGSKRVTPTDMRATDSSRRESLKSPLDSPSIHSFSFTPGYMLNLSDVGLHKWDLICCFLGKDIIALLKLSLYV